jgi:hypothetical protein
VQVPPTTTVSPAAVLAALRAQPAPFPPSALATALGTTVQGAKDLLTSLATTSNPLLGQDATPGTCSVGPGVDLGFGTALAIPSTAVVATPPTPTAAARSAPVTGAAVLAALLPYLPSQVLERSLGTAFNCTPDKVVAVAALAGQSLTATDVAAAVRGNGPLTPLTTLVANLLPLAVVFASSAWNASPAPAQGPAPEAPLHFVRTNPPVFGLAQGTILAPLTLPQIRALSAYAAFVQRLLATTPGPTAGTQADLQGVLSSYAGATPPAFPQAEVAALGRVLGVSAGIVVGLTGQVTLSSTAALALQQLDRAAQLASTLGLDGATLGALATDDYDKLSEAADALVLALGARYPDPKTQASKLDAAEQPVRAAKRDALVDYLITTPPYSQRWSTANDLYEYFLIDVAAGGCASTSWVVSATMSAQLYVYRAIMNL